MLKRIGRSGRKGPVEPGAAVPYKDPPPQPTATATTTTTTTTTTSSVDLSSEQTFRDQNNKSDRTSLSRHLPGHSSGHSSRHPSGHSSGHSSRHPSSHPAPASLSGSEGSRDDERARGEALVLAAANDDEKAVRGLLDDGSGGGLDVNYVNSKGRTALHEAVLNGFYVLCRLLLLRGADIDVPDRRGRNSLYLATERGHPRTVGILLDYLHSVDKRPRSGFLIVRARQQREEDLYFVEQASSCSKVNAFKQRKVDFVQLLVAHGQQADEMAVFLYSSLDVPVGHSFFLNIHGDLNMRNFQRHERKTKSQSLTIINSLVRSIDMSGYQSLKSLILVSCSLKKLMLTDLVSLELLDVSFNKMDEMTESIKDCVKLKTLKCSHNKLKRFVREVGNLKALETLDISYNHINRLTPYVSYCVSLKRLTLSHNELSNLPVEVGALENLEEFEVHNNKLCILPLSITSLKRLQAITFHRNPLQNIPVDFPNDPERVREYLRAMQQDPVACDMVKLVLVGQEGVGKTTLLKALRRSMWLLSRNPQTPKTDGIEVKDLQLDESVNLKCFDFGGDVDFNETHNFFITQGALYLVCFDLSEYCRSTVERSSFLFGRLQLWLQYIFSKVPSSQVLIVGTHADHDELNKEKFHEIWEHMRELLVKARDHHRKYFHPLDRIGDCLLCQPDPRCLRRNASVTGHGYVAVAPGTKSDVRASDTESGSDTPSRIVSFPHIVGYYEVSSVKSMGGKKYQINTNPSIDHLKEAIKMVSKRILSLSPEIPRRWANALQALQNHRNIDKENSVVTRTEVSRVAGVQGVVENAELDNMLHFLKAQGHLLFFPRSETLRDLVVLDPQWLAKLFASVVSYRDTGISNEGFIERDRLRKIWHSYDEKARNKIVELLRYFGVCLPIVGTNTELFPCKLPIGDPDENTWPAAPRTGQRQLTYSVTFPSIIPPPFFSDLIVAVYRQRVENYDKGRTCCYFQQIVVETLAVPDSGCRTCGKKERKLRSLEHPVRFELQPHRRVLLVTARGPSPCCMIGRLNRLLNNIVSMYEGLGSILLDSIVCPGCAMQRVKLPYRFSAKLLLNEKVATLTCPNGHFLPDPQKLLQGDIHKSCLPIATIRKKSGQDRKDFSSCPRMFIMLPVNKDGLSFDSRSKIFASSLLFDGFSLHFVCEFPDGYHLPHSPGYRLKRPEDLVSQYGSHMINVFRLLRIISMASTVSANGTTRGLSRKVDELLADMKRKFPGLKEPPPVNPDVLVKKVLSAVIDREHIRVLCNLVDVADRMGPLRRFQDGESTLWLCNDHYRQLQSLSFSQNKLQSETRDSKA